MKTIQKFVKIKKEKTPVDYGWYYTSVSENHLSGWLGTEKEVACLFVVNKETTTGKWWFCHKGTGKNDFWTDPEEVTIVNGMIQ